jgi:hypothetical protein
MQHGCIRGVTALASLRPVPPSGGAQGKRCQQHISPEASSVPPRVHRCARAMCAAQRVPKLHRQAQPCSGGEGIVWRMERTSCREVGQFVTPVAGEPGATVSAEGAQFNVPPSRCGRNTQRGELAQVLLSLRAHVTRPSPEGGQCHGRRHQPRQAGKVLEHWSHWNLIRSFARRGKRGRAPVKLGALRPRSGGERWYVSYGY